METDAAVNGLEAVKKERTTRYDIILMNIRMLLMDGLDAIKAICLFDSCIPIVALSANVYGCDREASFAAGMNRHVAKSVDKRELLEVLTKLV